MNPIWCLCLIKARSSSRRWSVNNFSLVYSIVSCRFYVVVGRYCYGHGHGHCKHWRVGKLPFILYAFHHICGPLCEYFVLSNLFFDKLETKRAQTKNINIYIYLVGVQCPPFYPHAERQSLDKHSLSQTVFVCVCVATSLSIK